MGPVIAATAGTSDLTAWAILAAMVWACWYVVVCALYPWQTCTWCDGGKKRSLSGRNWRDCRHCAGSGRRPRIGRRAWTALSRGDRK